MKLRLVATFALAVMMLAALALPSAAQSAGIGVLNGNAKVGATFDNAATADVTEGCGDSGVPDSGVYGRGLRFPDPTQIGGIDGVWALSTVVNGAPVSGELSICGELGQNAAGVGASCGMSEGTDGRGVFAEDYQLSDITWPTSAGGTLPTVGSWTNASDGTSGVLVSLVQAQGGTDCTTQNGATSFTVVGVTSLIEVPQV